MTTPIITYTTQGPVRGTCGRTYDTPEAAMAAVLADRRAVAHPRRADGTSLTNRTAYSNSRPYSDRRVVRTDGQPLDPRETERIDEYLDALAESAMEG